MLKQFKIYNPREICQPEPVLFENLQPVLSGILGKDFGLTLDYNFLLKSGSKIKDIVKLGPIPVFTRASIATNFDENGILVTTPANEPRFDHNLANNNVPLGLLIEEARTNFALQSEGVVAPWMKFGALSLPINNDPAPDGTMTADRIVDISTVAFQAFQQNISISTALLPWVWSVYCNKQAFDTFPEFQFIMTGGVGVTAAVQLNLQTGATVIRVDPAGAGLTIAVEELANHWRYSMTMTNTGGNNVVQIGILPAASNSILGALNLNAVGGVGVWGHQVEQGSFATSYIKTTTAPVTRMADLVSTSDVSWFNAIEGTFFVEANDGGTPPGAPSSRLIELNDGADSDRLLMDVSNGKPRIFVDDGGITQAALKATDAIVRGTTFKVAGAYKLNDIAVTSEGTTVNTDTMATMPDETNFNFTIGTDRAAAIAFWNGPIARVRYWDFHKSGNSLQSITR